MDRQETDIDALLIGALYGELTPAEEGRLAAHLESHPADRGALDDLKVARQAIHESRIFSVQLDPPQAVSALLLQEAHRRAPKRVVAPAENEGWFARFTRNFMAHPAMAAAAMLVLVLGGAGIVYMKKGDQFAAREAHQESAAQSADQSVIAQGAAAPATATPTMPSGGDGAAGGAPSAGSAFGANLYEGNAEQKRDESDSDKASDRAAADNGYRGREELSKKKAPSRSMEVTTERMPKDFDDAKESKNDLALDSVDKPAVVKAPSKGAPSGPAAATGTGASAGRGDFGALGDSNTNAISGAGVACSGNGNYAQPPPPPASKSAGAATTPPKPAPATTSTTPSTTKPATASPPQAPEATAAPAPAKEAKPDAALIAWAKGEHARAVSLAKNGSCEAAAKVALSVSNRATGYYSQYMATDRALKQCAQYINAERDREAERTQKARAQKRVNADEPSAVTK